MLNEIASAATILSQEEIPADFQVDFRSLPHTALFGRFDFLNTAILDMAQMATTAWNSDVPAKKFAAPYFVAIGFVSSRSGPGLLVKHVVWALDRIFDTIVNGDEYRSSNFVVRLGPTTLGVGNVISVEKQSAAVIDSDKRMGGLVDNTTEDSVSALIPTNDTALDSSLTLPAYWQGNSSPIQTLPVTLTSDTSVNLAAAGRVSLRFWYRPNGAHVDDAQVYNASLKLLIQAAEPSDLKETIWPGLTTYNSKEDFTFTIRPISYTERDSLANLDAIFSLASIVGMMAKSGGPPGRFGELYGNIKAGQSLIGRFCIDKGDKTGLDLHGLCYDGD